MQAICFGPQNCSGLILGNTSEHKFLNSDLTVLQNPANCKRFGLLIFRSFQVLISDIMYLVKFDP